MNYLDKHWFFQSSAPPIIAHEVVREIAVSGSESVVAVRHPACEADAMAWRQNVKKYKKQTFQA